MARTQLTLDGLDINDGVNYFLLPGINVGAAPLSYDEYIGYDGNVAIANVSATGIVGATIPLDVRATSLATMKTKFAAINTKIATCTWAAPKNLVYDGTTYYIVNSQQVIRPEDELARVSFVARFVIALNRKP